MKPETIQEHFRDPRALEHYAQAAAKLGLWVSEKKVFQQTFRLEDHLLDLGCGAGRIAFGLWDLGFRRLTGADFVPEMVARARGLAEVTGKSIEFTDGDATALDFADGSFDGIIFGFNGLMQIPGRERRQRAFSEILRVLRPGGSFVFTTHDRANRRFRVFWEAEVRRWMKGEQDPRLVELGDSYYESSIGATFMHIPTRQEVLEDLAATGWAHEEDFLRCEVAREPAKVREFSDECRFWIARKPVDVSGFNQPRSAIERR
ncbi:MAG TPA: class I SAM-dependent methyltransferase [Opitutales bacterium]|nr:class I SAM-dependent methyltransferase [Opitutales bacterium]